MGPELRRDLEALLPLIEKTFPVPGRFRRGLPADVAELSRLLTSGRGERSPLYLNRPPMLSAYLRYFLPWNLYRLCRLLPALELPLAAGDRILDLGAGPLTFPIALWLCRPEFRVLPLEFRCQDLSRAALDAGKKLFASLSGGCPWTITITSRHGLRDPAEPKGGAALVAVLNMYNEVFQSISPGDEGGLYRLAETQGALLASLAGKNGRILVVEPGIPRSGQFIALLRGALVRLGRPPLSPCPHGGPCPFPGPVKGPGPRQVPQGPPRRRGPSFHGGGPPAAETAADKPGVRGVSKWCHFAFGAQDAPAALRRLSTAAGLPKERATLSFLLAGPARANQTNLTDQPDRANQSNRTDPTSRPGRARPDRMDQRPGRGGKKPGPAAPLPELPEEQGPSPVRLISDPFPLGAPQDSREWGRYGCAPEGMALVRGGRTLIESLSSGALIRAAFTGLRDPKTGALLCRPAEAD
jgi:hypothetical protein